ncbi:MAG TPA: EAL domain-containing protein [Acidimicrobiia bacterium]|nr:EAL domain-containing protein [Acidimicrobiia bacterium]
MTTARLPARGDASNPAAARFATAFAAAPIGMAIATVDGELLDVNAALCRMLGYSASRLGRMRLEDLAHPDEVWDQLVALHRLRIGEIEVYQARRRFRTVEGTIVWVSWSASAVMGDRFRPTHLICHFADLTEQIQAEAALVHQALHDPLTGLPNRTLLIDRIDRVLAQREREGGTVAVLFIDLDRFKLVNDTHGHGTGDQLLVEVADRLRRLLRATDTVARLGGDEFVVVTGPVQDAGDVSLLAERILSRLAEPCRIGSTELLPTSSVGIATADGNTDTDCLLRNANIALHHAKDAGRDQWALYDDELRNRAARRLRVEGDLRRGLDHERFVVYYQPILSVADRTITGGEALLRLRQDGWLRPPGEFLPVAEDTSLIVPIGTWALEQACRAATAWSACPRGTPDVAVNLSARQLAVPDLPRTIAHALTASGLDPHRLHLELTETVLLQATPDMTRTLQEIRALGPRLGIDDFGTGYASLTYLRRFPIDFVKIDRSFVAGLGRDRADDMIVRAVIGLARDLGLATVAEGVETEAQLDGLRSLGCTSAQGFLFSRPVPERDFAALLDAETAAAVR